MVTPPPRIVAQGCLGGLGINREHRLVGHSRGTIWWRLSFRVLGTASREEGSRWGARGEEAGGGGGGSDLAWRREVVPSSPRRSGGGLTGGGSILSLAQSFCLPIRFLSLGSTRIPGTENGAIAYTNVCGKGAGVCGIPC